jgi:hypothetical protein
MPSLCGVGFTDVGLGQPGTDSSQFKSSDFGRWRQVRAWESQICRSPHLQCVRGRMSPTCTCWLH